MGSHLANRLRALFLWWSTTARLAWLRRTVPSPYSHLGCEATGLTMCGNIDG